MTVNAGDIIMRTIPTSIILSSKDHNYSSLRCQNRNINAIRQECHKIKVVRNFTLKMTHLAVVQASRVVSVEHRIFQLSLMHKPPLCQEVPKHC